MLSIKRNKFSHEHPKIFCIKASHASDKIVKRLVRDTLHRIHKYLNKLIR